jgi:predicted nucleic acid-binding protein
MPAIVVADTSCLILLQKIGQLQLLSRLYENVRVTPDVVREFGSSLPHWFLTEHPMNHVQLLASQGQVDAGEASAIALALELPDAYLIIDDRRARKVALHFGLRITGTLGVLLEAKQAGYLPALRPVFSEIRRTNFRLTDTLESTLLQLAGEK